MTSIDFHVNPDPFVLYVCKLIRKVWKAGHRVVCFTQDEQLLSQLNQALWEFSQTDFLPHVTADHALAPETPIILLAASDATHLPQVLTPATSDVLINLDLQPPPFFARFQRMVEVVSADEQHKVAGRQRYAFYRDRGYPLKIHDLRPKARAA